MHADNPYWTVVAAWARVLGLSAPDAVVGASKAPRSPGDDISDRPVTSVRDVDRKEETSEPSRSHGGVPGCLLSPGEGWRAAVSKRSAPQLDLKETNR